MKKLLILSVSAGNGHVRAAQALQAAAQQLPQVSAAVHIDAMQHVASGFRKVYTDGYLKLVNSHPGLWSYLHEKSDSTPHDATSQRLRRAIERLSSRDLLRTVRAERPDAIICTHFLPAELLMRERDREHIDCPLWLQVTDYDLHNMWLVPGMAGYFAATEEVAWRMRSRGLPEERLHVTGIPVMPAFSQPDAPELARAACRSALGLPLDKPVLLMASGGAGVGDLPSMVADVLELPGDFRIIAVAGRNEAAHATLQGLARQHAGRLLAIGFTNQMHQLMAAADLVVTKPGGLTVSECLALGRPMLLISPIPGQEEHNAGYLMEQGAAWLAYDRIGLRFKIMQLMNSCSSPATPDVAGKQHDSVAKPVLYQRERLTEMAACSRRIGRPDAAQAVLAHVLGQTPGAPGVDTETKLTSTRLAPAP